MLFPSAHHLTDAHCADAGAATKVDMVLCDMSHPAYLRIDSFFMLLLLLL